MPNTGRSSKEPTGGAETVGVPGASYRCSPPPCPCPGLSAGLPLSRDSPAGSWLPQLQAYTAQLQDTRNVVNICEFSWGLLANKCKRWLRHGGWGKFTLAGMDGNTKWMTPTAGERFWCGQNAHSKTDRTPHLTDMAFRAWACESYSSAWGILPKSTHRGLTSPSFPEMPK